MTEPITAKTRVKDWVHEQVLLRNTGPWTANEILTNAGVPGRGGIVSKLIRDPQSPLVRRGSSKSGEYVIILDRAELRAAKKAQVFEQTKAEMQRQVKSSPTKVVADRMPGSLYEEVGVTHDGHILVRSEDGLYYRLIPA